MFSFRACFSSSVSSLFSFFKKFASFCVFIIIAHTAEKRKHFIYYTIYIIYGAVPELFFAFRLFFYEGEASLRKSHIEFALFTEYIGQSPSFDRFFKAQE